MSDITRDVLLRIRAQNLSTADFNAVSAAIRRLTSDLDRQIETAVKAGNRERELGNELKRLEQAAKGLEQISRLIDNFKAFESTLKRSEDRVSAARQKLDEYRAKLEQTNDTSARAEQTLARLVKRLENEEAQLTRNRQTHQANAEAIRKSGFEVNNLADAETRLKQAAEQAGAGITKLSTAVLDYSKNARVAKEQARQLQQEFSRSIAAQESQQLRQFQTFKEQQQKETQIRAEAAARERRLREAEIRAGQEAVARFRKLRQESVEAQRPITPLPGAGPRTDAMGRPGRGASAPVSFLGLRPYELTNLGYQVNDVITGLISGQNATQVLAQQGGQFIQIFGMAALRWFPLVAAAATAVSVAVGALTRSLREAGSEREFAAILRVNANAANYTATQLTALRKEIRDMAVSWDDAGKVIKQAVAANIRPELIGNFAQLAKDISRVNGVEVPEAMQQLIKGLTGGRDAIENLTAAYPVLNDAQLRHVRSLLAEGKQGEAQTTVLRILSQAYRDAADKGTSPFTKATEELSKKWDDLLIRLGKSQVFTSLVSNFTNLIESVSSAVGVIDGLLTKLSDPRLPALSDIFSLNPASRIGDAIGRGVGGLINGQAPTIAQSSIGNESYVRSWLSQRGYSDAAVAGIMGNIAVESGFNPAARNATGHFGIVQWDKNRQAPLQGSTDIARQLGLLDEELEKLDPAFKKAAQSAEEAALRFERVFERSGGQLNDKRVAAARKYAGGTTDGVQTSDTVEQSNAADRLIKTERERLEISRAADEAAEEAVIRRQALERIQDETRDKDKQNAYVQTQVDQFRDERLKERYRQEQEQQRTREQDVKNLNVIQEAGERARADALAKGITNYKTLYDIQRQGEAEERSRLQRVQSEADQLDAIRKRVSELRRSNSLKETSALEKALEAVNIQYENEIKNLEKFAERSTTVRRDDIDQLRRQIELARQRAAAKATVASYDAQAGESLSTRQQLIQTYSNLERSGELSVGERDQKIKEAFELTAPAINAAADGLERFVNSAEGLDLPPEKIALLTARIKELRSETKYVDPFLKGLRDTIKDSFSSGLDTTFNTVAEAIGGVIAKTKEWKDVFTTVKSAAMNLFSQLLKDIASYIIKAEAAKLASSLFGGSGGGGLSGILGSLFGGGGGASAATASASAASQVGAVGFSVFHGGGVVGRGNAPIRRHQAATNWFEHAPRYHRGTVVGLGPRERAAILEDGEEVLSRDNPRNIANRRGSSGGGDIAIRSVLVDDRERIPDAMAGSHGERVVVQHIVRNAATIRQVLKG